jgi:hypothetical protein
MKDGSDKVVTAFVKGSDWDTVFLLDALVTEVKKAGLDPDSLQLIEVNGNEDILAVYKVTKTPTVIYFQDTEEVSRLEGETSLTMLGEFFEYYHI